MAKFPHRSKLSKERRQELILFLCQALQSLQNEEEVAKFIADLLSPPEIEMLSKRLEVAILLIQGHTYQEIRNRLNVGFTTISRIQNWTNKSGEGFQMALSRRKPLHIAKNKYPNLSDQLKRKYPAYYWPEILIDNILASSDTKHQEIINNLISKMLTK